MSSSLALPAVQHEGAGAVLTKAVLRAADELGVTSTVLATTLGLSAPSVSRMRRGGYALAPGSKPFELGVLFVRLFRSLDALVGGDRAAARAWLASENTALGGIPARMIVTIGGLADVIAYLDARRAPI
jgi:hypothetical protein